MDSVLPGVPRKECVVYLDDVLVNGKTFQSALDSLRGGFGKKLQWLALKLHPEKCHFMQREVEFLGHRVSGGGIRMLGEKVCAIRDWPTPNDQEFQEG